MSVILTTLLMVKPGPRDGIIQCYIKRDKSNMTYHLYLSLSPGKLFVFVDVTTSASVKFGLKI